MDTQKVRKVLADIEADCLDASGQRRASLEKKANSLRAGLATSRKEELPESCRDALATLVEFATATWLQAQREHYNERYPTFCANNIENQLLLAVFRPKIGPPSDPFHPDPRRGISSA